MYKNKNIHSSLSHLISRNKLLKIREFNNSVTRKTVKDIRDVLDK